MEKKVILTTGIYDLIKDHIKRRKVTFEQEAVLVDELRNANQVLRKDLPEDVVTVDRKLVIKDLTTNQQREMFLVGPKKAKIQKNRFSILSDIGLATVGHKVGETVNWPTPQGEKQFQIVEVAAMY